MSTQPTRLGVLLRIIIFAFLCLTGMMVFGWAFQPFGYLVTATMSTFAAAAIANAVALRVYERGRLEDAGLGWTAASRHNLSFGFVAGLLAASTVTAIPVLVGAAELLPNPQAPFNPGSLVFTAVVLLFGVVGEEMLFRGYGFQVFMALAGPFAAILPMSVLFALAHAANQNASFLGLTNTFLWGVLLGYGFLRSGDLWLPIGLHFGWNLTLPLFGVNLSGFTMGLTGYAMRWKAGDVWSGGSYGPEAGLLTTMLMPMLFCLLAKAPVRKQQAFLLRSREDA
jgi:membrane protease YdiL (CAAX protease family)